MWLFRVLNLKVKNNRTQDGSLNRRQTKVQKLKTEVHFDIVSYAIHKLPHFTREPERRYFFSLFHDNFISNIYHNLPEIIVKMKCTCFFGS